jgi:hypothetical protein
VLFAMLAVCLLAGCGSLGLQAHTIALAFKAGDVYKYKLHATFKYTVSTQGFSMPFDLEVSARDTVTVNSVDSGGVADVTVQLSELTVRSTINGTTKTETPKTETVNLKIGADGRVVSVNGSALGSSSMPDFSGTGTGLLSAVLPDGSVRVGDTWTKTYDVNNPMGTGAVHVKAENKYLRDEKVGGVDTAVVQSKITHTVDLTISSGSLGVPMSPTGASKAVQSLAIKGTVVTNVTSWIDTRAQRIVKTHSTGTTDATLTINNASSPAASPGFFTGPISFKGTQALEMDPA